MKAKHTVFAAAFLSLALSSFSSAETLYVTGSTAFRASFVSSVVRLMTFPSGTATAKWSGSGALSAANQAVISGTIAGVPMVVNCSWTGSVSGIQSLAAPASRVDSFLSETGLTAITIDAGTYPNTTTFTGGANGATGTTAGEADICMSDVFQGSTAFTDPALTDLTVAVVPFKLVASDGSPASISNMTPLITQLLYGSGRISQSLFTGSSADNGKFVYALGRDAGSGTRATVMAESGKGALNPVKQYLTANGTTYSLTADEPTTVAIDPGNGGSGSGSGVATQLGFTSAAATGYSIGYLGLTDASTAITAGAKELTWNGIAYSAAKVYGGQYTMWGYQHLFVGPDSSANDQTVATSISEELKVNPGTAGLALSLMNVQRGAEGGLVDLNN